MLAQVFERFVQNSPLSVMVRGTLEHVLGADQLDPFYERTANTQYTRELLFSTVYDLMSDVVFRYQPSVRAAYRARASEITTFLTSVYNKLNGLNRSTPHWHTEVSSQARVPAYSRCQVYESLVVWFRVTHVFRIGALQRGCVHTPDRSGGLSL